MVRVMDVNMDSLAGSQVRNVFFLSPGKATIFCCYFFNCQSARVPSARFPRIFYVSKLFSTMLSMFQVISFENNGPLIWIFSSLSESLRASI